VAAVEPETVPSAPATARIETADSPPESANAIVVPRSSHNAANIARARVVESFATFFPGTLATA
jgi:hypothetical protein